MTNKSIRDYINLIESAQSGVVEAAPSTELQDKMRQVRPKGKGITRTELQNAMRRKGKKQWHCPECATYDDNVHGKFCSKYKPKEQDVAEGTEQVYKVLAVDKSNALSKQVKLKVKASSLDEVFERLAISDWYPLEINGVEVINGKRLKQGVAEGEKYNKTPSGDYVNMHTGVRSSRPPQKKVRGQKTGAEWDAIEKAKKEKEQGVAEASEEAMAKIDRLTRD